jgi:hypothetical protein
MDLPDDIERKRPFWTAQMVARKLLDTFPDETARDRAVELLCEVADDPAIESCGDPCRIQLAVLRLGAGDVGELEEAVAIARSDWRDVLVPAEYPSQGLATDGPSPEGLAGPELLEWICEHAVPAAPGDVESDTDAYLGWLFG